MSFAQAIPLLLLLCSDPSPQYCRENVLLLLLHHGDTDCHPVKDQQAGPLPPSGRAVHLRRMAHCWANPAQGCCHTQARVCCQPCLTSPSTGPCPTVLQQWQHEKQDCKAILVSSITNPYFCQKISPFMDNYTHRSILKAFV